MLWPRLQSGWQAAPPCIRRRKSRNIGWAVLLTAQPIFNSPKQSWLLTSLDSQTPKGPVWSRVRKFREIAQPVRVTQLINNEFESKALIPNASPFHRASVKLMQCMVHSRCNKCLLNIWDERFCLVYYWSSTSLSELTGFEWSYCVLALFLKVYLVYRLYECITLLRELKYIFWIIVSDWYSIPVFPQYLARVGITFSALEQKSQNTNGSNKEGFILSGKTRPHVDISRQVWCFHEFPQDHSSFCH